MVKLFDKESRLIVIFFLIVIILGSVLIYLSISNISNYRELTKKRISEEQIVLAKQFSSDFQNKLEELISSFEEKSQKDSTFQNKTFNHLNKFSGIEQTVVFDQSGFPIWPNFLLINQRLKSGVPSPEFLEILRDAEKNEFVQKNFIQAQNDYSQALEKAKSKSDSAFVFNALSRLYLKQNKPLKAFEMYSVIIKNYRPILNASGFPYSYFAIGQLLKLNVEYRPITNLLILFLSDLDDGNIPMNYSTQELLNDIRNWNAINNGNELHSKIEAYIKNIQNNLNLIFNYNEALSSIFKGDKSLPNLPTIGNYIVLRPQNDNTKERLLFNKNLELPSGFTVNLDTLYKEIHNSHGFKSPKFELDTELVKIDDSNSRLNDDLVNISDFSLYFNDHRLKISLKEKAIVEEYVLKRKLIFGAGFILLLGVLGLGFHLIVQNINREKQMNRLRADFVSNVTHELKTPLTAIHMFAESIALGRASNQKTLNKYVNIILKESENLQRIINNILEFSRKESDKLNYEIRETNISEVICSVIAEMSYWLEINRFKVKLEVPEKVTAQANVKGLKQALSNLVSNAIKYSNKSKDLIIRLKRNRSHTIIEVEDFGMGIPKDKLGLIFQKFYRINNKENASTSGTGLGLTVTKDIIEAQQGEILVESKIGKGSKFTIVLNN